MKIIKTAFVVVMVMAYANCFAQALPVESTHQSNESARKEEPWYVKQRNTPYVTTLTVVIKPSYPLAFGSKVPAAKMATFSKLAGLKLSNSRAVSRVGSVSIATIVLPHNILESEGEALCKKILLDKDIAECGPSYMIHLEGNPIPNDHLISAERNGVPSINH